MKRGGHLKRTKGLDGGDPLRRSTPLRSGHSREGRAKPPAPAKRKTSASTVVPKKIRDAVMERDERHCQRCGTPIDGKPHSLQHRDPRGMGGSKLLHTMANLVLLCGDALFPGYCHSEVESYRTRAIAEGWLVPMGIKAEDWPVKRFGQMWSMPGTPDEYGRNGWVECEPHPLQIDMDTAA
jgi:hypothetical protein